MVQIGHMVSQIAAMANQLRSMDGVLSMTTEFVNSNDPAMGNLGRVRDMLDRAVADGEGRDRVDDGRKRGRGVHSTDSRRDGRRQLVGGACAGRDRVTLDAAGDGDRDGGCWRVRRVGAPE